LNLIFFPQNNKKTHSYVNATNNISLFDEGLQQIDRLFVQKIFKKKLSDQIIVCNLS